MQLENSFAVGAPPERVFAYLLDVNKIVGCVPGAELSEVVDPTTFKGKVKVKVGPITVAYNGTAKISDRNDSERTATLEAEGRETTGPGSARAKAYMSVLPEGAGSVVKIVTDYSVCIKSNVGAAEPAAGGGAGAGASAPSDGPKPVAATAKPVNAFGLLFSVFWARVRAVFSRGSA